MNNNSEGNYLLDLNNSKLSELESLIDDYITIKAYIENFIVVNDLCEDEVWGKIENDYQEAMNRYYG